MPPGASHEAGAAERCARPVAEVLLPLRPKEMDRTLWAMVMWASSLKQSLWMMCDSIEGETQVERHVQWMNADMSMSRVTMCAQGVGSVPVRRRSATCGWAPGALRARPAFPLGFGGISGAHQPGADSKTRGKTLARR